MFAISSTDDVTFDYAPRTTGNELFTRVHFCVKSVVSKGIETSDICARVSIFSRHTPVSKIHVNYIKCFVALEANPYFAEVFIERRQG